MALRFLEKTLVDMEAVQGNPSLVIDVLKQLPVQDPYEAEALVMHQLVAASAQFDDVLVFWRHYVQTQESHVQARVTDDKAKAQLSANNITSEKDHRSQSKFWNRMLKGDNLQPFAGSAKTEPGSGPCNKQAGPQMGDLTGAAPSLTPKQRTTHMSWSLVTSFNLWGSV